MLNVANVRRLLGVLILFFFTTACGQDESPLIPEIPAGWEQSYQAGYVDRNGAYAGGYGRCRRATRACRAVANAREDAELCLAGHPREYGGQQLATDDVLRNDRATPGIVGWAALVLHQRYLTPSEVRRFTRSVRLGCCSSI